MIIDHAVSGPPPGDESVGVLDRFRSDVYECFDRRGDALSELIDAVTCGVAPVRDLARLSLEPAHRRGHGALYDALNAGCIDVGRLRGVIAGVRLPKVIGPDGRERIVLAVDVSNWLRPDAATSPDRSFCHT